MRPVRVEEATVLVDHALQSVQPEQDQVVQTLLPQRSDPALCMRVRIGRLERSLHWRHRRVTQDSVEVIAKACIVVVHQELRLDGQFLALVPTRNFVGGNGGRWRSRDMARQSQEMSWMHGVCADAGPFQAWCARADKGADL